MKNEAIAHQREVDDVNTKIKNLSVRHVVIESDIKTEEEKQYDEDQL